MSDPAGLLRGVACPAPLQPNDVIQMAHGGGGRVMHRLLRDTIIPRLTRGSQLQSGVDAAVLAGTSARRIAMTTDSYVIRPLFFPGGDIGSLAIHGTVNDLAMSGAQPQYISVGLIIEEGLPMDALARVLDSMCVAAESAAVAIVTGDTKVVDRGKADGLYINTTGIGIIADDVPCIGPTEVCPGDAVIVSGDLGRHGIAIMAVREGLEFETQIESDSTPLWGLVQSLLESGAAVHCLRDLTRGGLSSALNEIAEASGLSIILDETSIPVRGEVRGACEMLGLDPLYVANEGRLVAFVGPEHAEQALEAMRNHEQGIGAALIGHVREKAEAPVLMRTSFGPLRVVDMLSGEQLPRIC
jgi:hydrogenase expression/formation protein HypE